MRAAKIEAGIEGAAAVLDTERVGLNAAEWNAMLDSGERGQLWFYDIQWKPKAEVRLRSPCLTLGWPVIIKRDRLREFEKFLGEMPSHRHLDSVRQYLNSYWSDPHVGQNRARLAGMKVFSSGNAFPAQLGLSLPQRECWAALGSERGFPPLGVLR